MWVVVKTTVPFWISIIRRHLIIRVPKKGIIILTATHISRIVVGVSNLVAAVRSLAHSFNAVSKKLETSASSFMTTRFRV